VWTLSKYLSNSEKDRSFYPNPVLLFDFVSRDYEKYSGTRAAKTIEPFLKEIYPETETEGYIWCKIKKNDVPFVVFAEKSSTDGLWFKTS